jgi:hypothetical protein
LHTHDPEQHGFAHIHVFCRTSGRHVGARRGPVLTHIAAVEIDALGWPTKLVALNQWVTGDLWQPARNTLALVDRLDFRAHTPEGDTGRWLVALLGIYWFELRALLEARDRRLQRALEHDPAVNVLIDRELEIVASRRIDLRRRLRELGAL